MVSSLSITIVALIIISTVSTSDDLDSKSRRSAESADIDDYSWDGYYKSPGSKNRDDDNDTQPRTTQKIDTTASSNPVDGPGGDGSGSENSCENTCTDGITMPNFCDYAAYQWDDPSTPLDERNNIGRANLLSSTNVLKANALVTQGKIYKLSYEYTNDMPAFGTRSWYTSLRNPMSILGENTRFTLYEFADANTQECGTGIGYLDQRLMTSANGNSGTQFDALGHIFYMNGEYGDSRNYLFHNGFTGTDVMKEFGVDYIGIESMPSIVTRAILLDVSGYYGQDPLPADTKIDTNMVEDTLKNQGLSVDDIEEGDVVLVYTGWAHDKWSGDAEFYYGREPGLTLDTVINIFGPKGVVMLGADQWGVEYKGADEDLTASLHTHWIVCNGGFLYENMKLNEWTMDARNGNAPYIGAFYYTPAQIKGGVGGLGTPIVIV